MSRRLFKRAMRLTFAHAPVGSFIVTSEEVSVTGLRVQFSISKSLDSSPNSCTATIFNLAPRTRAELQRPRVRVRLDVGYDGELGRIFIGDILHSESELRVVDIETRLLLSDGGRALKGARVSRTFKAGTDARTAFKAVADSMGMRMPTSISDAEAMATQFASGITLSGPSQEQMTKIVKAAGYTTWSVQDDQLQVLGDDETRSDPAIDVNVETGMLGSPLFGTPDKDGKPAPLKVSKLIDPGAIPIPGGRIRVTSREIKGALFKVIRVTHVGDTHGNDWHSNMEALPL